MPGYRSRRARAVAAARTRAGGGQQQHPNRAGDARTHGGEHQQDHRQVPQQPPERGAHTGLGEQLGRPGVPDGQGRLTGEGDHRGHRVRDHQAERPGEDHHAVPEERRAHRGEALLAAYSAEQRHAPCLPAAVGEARYRTAATLNGSSDASITGVSER
ncbi:hypothetical protein TPA0908_07540 [Micromonospora sp. AKA38]|nr:hypothetical protein TPA0908_07540 [Micromonospora sp. AKA38]